MREQREEGWYMGIGFNSSVGCFVTHCGSGSLIEAMVNECQLIKVQKTTFLAFCVPPKCFAASWCGLEIVG